MVSLISIAGVAFLTGCQKSHVRVGKYEMYRTSITKIKYVKNGDFTDNYWKIKGTTTAPDGAKIIIASSNKKGLNYRTPAGVSDNVEWPKVKNGKFSAIVEPMNVVGNEFEKVKSGQKTAMAIMAVTGFNKSFGDTYTVPKVLMNSFDKSFRTTKLTLNSAQAKSLVDVTKPDKSPSDSGKLSAAEESELMESTAELNIQSRLDNLDTDSDLTADCTVDGTTATIDNVKGYRMYEWSTKYSADIVHVVKKADTENLTTLVLDVDDDKYVFNISDIKAISFSKDNQKAVVESIERSADGDPEESEFVFDSYVLSKAVSHLDKTSADS